MPSSISRERGREYRRRMVKVLEAHGGEIKTVSAVHQYGVSGLLRDEVGYQASATSWNSLLRRMVKEGIIEIVERDDKRIWHIRLSPERPHFLTDDDEDVEPYDLSDPTLGTAIDYDILAWAVLGAAAEAIAKPGRRLIRYKEMIRQLQEDNIALTARREIAEADAQAALEEANRLRAELEQAKKESPVPRVIDAMAHELGYERSRTARKKAANSRSARPR